MGRVAAVLIAVVLWSGSAAAQGVNDASWAAARELGYRGVESYHAGDYQSAFTKLDKAYQVLNVPTLGLWSARALIKLGRWVEAAERLRRVLRLEATGGDASVQQQALQDARAELEALQPRIPTVVISIEGAAPANVRVTLDGEAVAPALLGEPVPGNPGAHAVVAVHGSERVQQDLTLAEGARESVTLRFAEVTAAPGSGAALGASASSPAAGNPTPAPADQAPRRTRTVLSWVLVGTGAAGVAIGATTGFLAIGKKSDLEGSNDCRGTSCLPNHQSDVDFYNSMRTLATVGLVAGAVLATAGVVLIVSTPKPAQQAGVPSPGVSLGVSPGAAVVTGRF